RISPYHLIEPQGGGPMALDSSSKTGGGTSRRSWLPYLLIGLMAALLFVRSPAPGNRIGYSDLKAKIEQGQVAEVEIGRDRIRAVPADEAARKRGERWVVNRVDDPEFIKLLDRKHVAYGGVQESDWVSSILIAWVLPLALMAGFWLLVLRRMRPGAGIMSFG